MKQESTVRAQQIVSTAMETSGGLHRDSAEGQHKDANEPILSIQKLDKEIKQLPALSEIVTDVLALMDKGDVELPVLMKKIAQDQSLTARILKVANSPFYGFAQRIGSLKDAGIMLGVHSLRSIVIAAGVIGRFPAQGEGTFDRLAFWQHAIGTGITAKVLAGRCGLDQEIAFTAGLLHDIGKLVLDVHFPAEFIHVLNYRDNKDCLIKDAEQSVLGFDHSLIGAKAAKHWKLPPLIQEAIRNHHAPERSSATPLVALIHIADIVCRGLEIGNGGDNLIPELHAGALQRLGLDWDELKESLSDIEELNSGANLLIEVDSSQPVEDRQKSEVERAIHQR